LTSRILRIAGLILLLVIGAALLWKAAHLLLLLVAGLIFGVFLDSLTQFTARWTRLPRAASLGIVCLVLAALVGGACWWAGPRLADQSMSFVEDIQTGYQTLQTKAGGTAWGQWVPRNAPTPEEALSLTPQASSRALGMLSTMGGALVSALVVGFLGLYLAANPAVYRENALRLLPTSRREQADELLRAIRCALGRWLAGRASSMAVVGILTAIGLALLGMPLVLTLALLAALLSFVPNVGPVLAAVPAILIGFVQSPMQAVWVAGLYLAIQSIESYLITPFIQRRAVSIPPAMLLSVQLLFGFLGGVLGLLLATPLAVVCLILVQTLYIRDVLGDKIEILGQDDE
jgi:predicted PurR-regulated permease PerM